MAGPSEDHLMRNTGGVYSAYSGVDEKLSDICRTDGSGGGSKTIGGNIASGLYTD